MTTPTTAGGAVLPVVGYRLNSGHGNHLRETLDDATKGFLWAGKPAWRELTYLDTAQAEIDALRAELSAAQEQIADMQAAIDGAHNIVASYRAENERLLAALKAAQDDQARDAERLDWLVSKLSDRDFREAGLGYRHGSSDIRPSIDAAIAAAKETP